jgi:hypothetical protein
LIVNWTWSETQANQVVEVFINRPQWIYFHSRSERSSCYSGVNSMIHYSLSSRLSRFVSSSSSLLSLIEMPRTVESLGLLCFHIVYPFHFHHLNQLNFRRVFDSVVVLPLLRPTRVLSRSKLVMIGL